MKRLKIMIVATDKEGKQTRYQSLNLACEEFGLNTKTVYQYFRRNKREDGYLSKTGITLTKTEMK